MDDSLLSIVERLGSPRVLVVGDLMLDRYIWGNADRISPEAPIPVLSVVHREERLGGAAGVAAILRALDAKVTLVGVLGGDHVGRHCKSLLDEAVIDTALVVTDASRPTTLKERYIGRAEQKHPQQVLRVDYEAKEEISGSLLEQFTANVRQGVANHDVVLMSDYGKGVCQPEFIQALVQECRSRNVRILIDPGRKQVDLNRYRRCNSLTPNRREAGLATGKAVNDLPGACAAAAQLRRELDLEVGLITLDRDGMVLADHDGQQHFPARQRQVYDITGAGDVTLAMLGLVLASGFGYREAIPLANVAAGLSVEQIGVTTVTRQEILRDLLRFRPLPKEKLMPRSELVREMNRLRQAGQTIVFTNGCFDLLHSGHIHLLREARSQGDVLVVGLNSDASVRRLGKGSGRPIHDEKTRTQVLSALECVDYIGVFEEDTPWDIIQAVRPHVLVKGMDYRPENIVGKDFVEAYGGRLHLVHLQPGHSTTATIAKMLQS